MLSNSPAPGSRFSQMCRRHPQDRDSREDLTVVDYQWTVPLDVNPDLGSNAGQMPPATAMTNEWTENPKEQHKRKSTIRRVSQMELLSSSEVDVKQIGPAWTVTLL